MGSRELVENTGAHVVLNICGGQEFQPAEVTRAGFPAFRPGYTFAGGTFDPIFFQLLCPRWFLPANKCDQRLDLSLGTNQIGQTILLPTPESSRWSDVLCGLVAGTTRG